MDISKGIAAVLFMYLFSASFSAQSMATALDLPPPNSLSTGIYGDFNVYSLDLLAQCAAAGDPRCLPSGPYPVQSSPGQIADQLVIYTGNNGLSNYDGAPFTAGSQSTTAVDNPFRAPSGSGTTTFEMTAANEPGTGVSSSTLPEFSGDLIGRWDAALPSVLSYLTDTVTGVTSDLVFLFDNNQVGSDPGQWQSVWGQVRIFDQAGILRQCYELNSSQNSGCVDMGASPAPAIADYVPILGNFCVDKISGLSYNIGLVANAGGCAAAPGHPSGGYFVNNNLGQNNAEFAAYIPELNDNLEAWATLGWIMSVDIRLANLNDGPEQLWICDMCQLALTTPPEQPVPEPWPVFLLGLAFIILRQWRNPHARSQH